MLTKDKIFCENAWIDLMQYTSSMGFLRRGQWLSNTLSLGQAAWNKGVQIKRNRLRIQIYHQQLSLVLTEIYAQLSRYLTILCVYILLIVWCIVCKQLRVPTMYRRHLFSHQRRGNISEHEIHSILFDQRKRRKDSERDVKRLHVGFICQFPSEGVACGKIVLNLEAHLIHTL